MYLGEVIKLYRQEKGISQQAFADKCGLSKPYISQLENNRNPKTGEPAVPSSDTFVKVAQAMNISLTELLEMVDENQPVSLRVISDSAPGSSKPPIYEAAAGEGRINDGYPSDNMSLSLEDDQYYFNVCGQSMEPTLQDGDIVVVSATNVVKSQEDIMLVKINGDKATLKHVKIQDDGLYLYGENHAVYPARFFSAKEVEELPVTIEGVVVRLIRNM